MSTTIVEIDPAVYAAARQYFGLPDPGPGRVFLEDARGWVIKKRAEIVASSGEVKQELYDIVVHDCFSGGGLPKHIFTLEFWEDLKLVMNPEGVLAVVSFFHDFHPADFSLLDRILRVMQTPMHLVQFCTRFERPLATVVCSMIRYKASLKNNTKPTSSTWCASFRITGRVTVLLCYRLGLFLRSFFQTSLISSSHGIRLSQLLPATKRAILSPGARGRFSAYHRRFISCSRRRRR